ncbi:MAG: deoxyribose-phosphate aldolase [Flavobacteriales bacterium]|nr:deoxyribose-phosphate aldolase [Flavobacteriales bacterium]
MIFFKKTIKAALVAAFFVSCSTDSREFVSTPSGAAVVDSSIAFHGGLLYENVDLSFGFRGKEYKAKRQEGNYTYSNTYRDGLGLHERILSNAGFIQKLNGELIELSKKDSTARSASVNSVVYFALLPGLLNTPAAQKEYLGKEEIEDESYHKVRVTFTKEGGGEDFDDVFLYWFSVEDYSMDYLAYSYLEDQGGTRFRKAFDRRSVNGLVFQDYYNLRGPSPDSLEFISDLFKKGKLDTLSLIEVDRLSVSGL